MQNTFLFLLCVLFCAAYAGEIDRCIRKNEELRCVYKCPPEKTCDTKDIQFRCLRKECEKCENKCVCIDDYFRNDVEDCVSKEQCDRCPGPNEFFTCSSACDNECGKTQNRTNCKIINVKCNDRCYCKNGFSRNATGSCVPNEECPNIQCPDENEHLGCVIDSEPTCENRTPETDNCNGKPQCVCNKGLYRNANGKCVTAKECDRCKGPNEFLDCGNACDTECSRPDVQNRTNCQTKNEPCVEMCYCKDGYARDDKNLCVPISNCPPAKCDKNEVYRSIKKCPPEANCDTRNATYHCPLQKPNDPRNSTCICKKNYYRNYLGQCITGEECDKCKGDHEYYSSCGGACDNVCATLDTQSIANCNIQTFACVKMCYCKDGFARNETNNCIPIKECTKVCKGPHEYHMTCLKTCPPDTCASRLTRYDCPKNPPCVSGCKCQTKGCKGPHEYHMKCLQTCPSDTCAALVSKIRCPENPPCVSGCRCQTGFYRKENGQPCRSMKYCP